MNRRGVHLQPSSYYAGWMKDPEQRAYWLDLLQSMGMAYVVMITAGDSCLEVFDGKPAAVWLLERGIEPLIRNQARLPAQFQNMATVARTRDIWADFGKTPRWILWNEPGDPREWKDGEVPANWWQVFVDRWINGAALVVQNGGLPGFPDGPCYDFEECHPFRDTMSARWLWDEGHAWYAVHAYGKGRPVDYPYDDVTQFGNQYTQAQYDNDLDVYAQEPGWKDTPTLDIINQSRRDWAAPGTTILDDDTCWWAWKKIAHYAQESLGFYPQLAVTEGGWVPRDRAGGGGGHPIDDRWALTTPGMVAKKTLVIYEEDSPLFAICPWLLGCSLMGASGWEYDSWVTGVYRPMYDLELPVVRTLQENPPVDDGIKEAAERVRAARDRLAGALAALG